MKYLAGSGGSILYGGEEYAFPGGKLSEERLTELWGLKLAAKRIDVGEVMFHASRLFAAGEKGPVQRYVLTHEEE